MTTPETPRRLDIAGVAGVTLCCMLWGGNAVAVRFAVPDLPPIGCAGLRFLIALPVVALACAASGQSLWPARGHGRLLLLHALLSVAQIGTFNWGTGHSQAGRASVFINVHPLIVAPLSWIVLGETMGGRGIAGIIAAASGVVVLLSTGFETGGGIAGDSVVLLSGAIFGAQTIAQKRTFPIIPPSTLLFAQYVLAIPVFFAVSALSEGLGTYRFTPQATWGVLFQGLAVSGVCFVVWMTLLRIYPANRIATLAFMTPLFGVGLGILLLGEAFRWQLIAAGGLVGLGIYLVSSDRVSDRGPAPLGLPGEDAP